MPPQIAPPNPSAADASVRPLSGIPSTSPIVIFHGWGMSPQAYSASITILQDDGREVFAPLICVGGGLWDRRGAAAAIAPALEALGAPAVVVGHSLGGSVAITCASEYPELTAGLVLVNSVGVALPNRSAVSWIAPFPRYINALPPATALRVVADNVRHPSRLMHWVSAAMFALHADLEHLLPEIGQRVPSTVLWGKHDRLLPVECARRMSDLLDGPLVEVDGEHDWPLRDPLRFAQTLGSVVDSKAMRPRVDSIERSFAEAVAR